MRLAKTQSVFTAGLQPCGSPAQRMDAHKLIRKNTHIPPDLALRIYGNNVYGALIKALAAAHPACLRVLGEQCFNSIARRYCEQNPSERPDLNQYGATFAGFIEEWTGTHTQFAEYHYLGDLARLEWLCHTAYYAADNPPFDFRKLAAASRQEEAAVRLHPGHDVGLLRSDYPVMAIREVNLSANDAATVNAGDLPEFLVISRPSHKPEVARVDATTYAILAACDAGLSLGIIAGTVTGSPRNLTETLTGLIERGWISGVSTDAETGATHD